MKPRLSASQLNTLSTCGMRYYFGYVKGIRRPPGVALVLGKGGHKAVEANLKAKMATGALLPLEEVTQAAAEAVRQEWQAEEPRLSEEEQQIGRSRMIGQTVDTAVSLVSVHHKQAAPGIQPIAIEQGFVLELDGFPFDVIGYKDVVEAGRIRDTKFRGKAKGKEEAVRSTQLALYSLDAKAKGQPVREVVIDELVNGGRFPYNPKVHRPTEQDHLEVMARMEAAAKQIESGVFPPMDPGSPLCSAKYCGFYDMCPHGARQAVTLSLISPDRLRSRPAQPRIDSWADFLAA